jgi:hypothetical protein
MVKARVAEVGEKRRCATWGAGIAGRGNASGNLARGREMMRAIVSSVSRTTRDA